jgi:hypothetical protein
MRHADRYLPWFEEKRVSPAQVQIGIADLIF